MAGLRTVARACGVTYQAVRKWEANGKLPRTEYTGETNYAMRIAEACKAADPHSKITREALLGLPPVTRHDRHGVTDSQEAAA